MTEQFMYMYTAAPGETVTLEAKISGDAFIKVGSPMKQVDGDPSSWTLAIPDAGFQKTYGFKAAVEFQNPQEGYRVDFTISGSLGGSFPVETIDPTAETEKEPSFTIQVK
jgi:hypothetical protein